MVINESVAVQITVNFFEDKAGKRRLLL